MVMKRSSKYLKTVLMLIIAMAVLAVSGCTDAPKYAEGDVVSTGSAYIYIHGYWEDFDQYMTTTILENDVATIYTSELMDRDYIDNEPAWTQVTVTFSEKQLNIITHESAVKWQEKAEQTENIYTSVTFFDTKAKGGVPYWS